MQRYDGVAFRVVKRLQKLGQFPSDVDVVILSAKFGLIRHDQAIPNYNVRMTPALARKQIERNRTFLRDLLSLQDYREVFVSAGTTYLLALGTFNEWRGAAIVTVNKGRIGFQLKNLRDWLLQSK